MTDYGTLALFDRETSTITTTYSLSEPSEVITTIKTISLEISEHTHDRADLVCVGSALVRGEDLPAMGHIYIFAIIDVVPEPEKPETGKAFKLIAQEEVKGAVTALSGIGTQGFLMVAQGQKCMVKGLKEDGSLLPLAFMDMQVHITVAKELDGTGLCLMGDALKGVWFCGYTVRLSLSSSREPSALVISWIGIRMVEFLSDAFTGGPLPTPSLQQNTLPNRSS